MRSSVFPGRTPDSGGLIRDITPLGTAYFADGSANRVFGSDSRSPLCSIAFRRESNDATSKPAKRLFLMLVFGALSRVRGQRHCGRTGLVRSCFPRLTKRTLFAPNHSLHLFATLKDLQFRIRFFLPLAPLVHDEHLALASA